jgi:hypothetical protein
MPTAPLTASDAYVESQRRLAAAAHARLQTALDAQDTVGVAASLSPDVRLVTPHGDTASGELVLRYLMFLAGDRTRPLRIGHGRLAACLEGDVYEYDGDLTVPPRSGTYANGRVAILWAVDERPVTARRMVMSGELKSVRGALPCQLEYKWAAGQRRWTGTIAAEMSQPAPSLGTRDVRRAMRDRGLAYAVGTENIGPGDRPFPQVQPKGAGATLGLRRRVDPVRSLELVAGVRLPEKVTGYDSSTKRYVSATGLPLTVSLLAQYQRGAVRVGFGPAALLGNWRVTEEERILVVETLTRKLQNPYTLRLEDVSTTTSTWVPVAGSSATSKYGLSPAIGLATDVAFMRALSRRSVVELRLSAAAMTSSRLPGTPGFNGARAGNSVARIGVALGRGW